MENKDDSGTLSGRDMDTDEGVKAHITKRKSLKKASLQNVSQKRSFKKRQGSPIPSRTQSSASLQPKRRFEKSFGEVFSSARFSPQAFAKHDSKKTAGSSALHPYSLPTEIGVKPHRRKQKQQPDFEHSLTDFSSEDEFESIYEQKRAKDITNLRVHTCSKSVLENKFLSGPPSANPTYRQNASAYDPNLTLLSVIQAHVSESFHGGGAKKRGLNVSGTHLTLNMTKNEFLQPKSHLIEDEPSLVDLEGLSDEEDKTLPQTLTRQHLPPFNRQHTNDQSGFSVTEGLKKQAQSRKLSNESEILPQTKTNLGLGLEKLPSQDSLEKSIFEEENVQGKLIQGIFNHDLDLVQNIVEKSKTLKLNETDERGNTPLMLAAKLSYRHVEYFELIQILLENGADPRIRDINGWSCMDEAVSQSDAKLISILFDQLAFQKQITIKAQQQDLIKILTAMPDFYLEMRWDFESSLVPFISKFAPSDTFKIWKYGKYLRMDNSLVSFKKLKSKRRNMSLLFNPDATMPADRHACGYLFLLNRNRKSFTNILQDIDIEEKKHMMVDMLRANPLQGSFIIKDCTWAESKSLFGNNITHKIGDYETKKFDFRITMEYAVFKKSHAFFKDTYEAYNEKPTVPAEEILNQRQIFNRKNPKAMIDHIKGKNGVKQTSVLGENKNFQNLNGSRKALNIETFENTQVTEKKASASIWFAQNFPIHLKQLLPILQFLSKGNDLLQKMESLLAREEVISITSKNSFPMKVQLPVALGIKANIVITKYEPLSPTTVDVRDVFFPPAEFEYVSRKDAQKTPIRRQKRLLLANVLL